MTVGSTPSAGLVQVQSRISAIQAQIASLTPPKVGAAIGSSASSVAPSSVAASSGGTFAAALDQAVDRQAFGAGRAASIATVAPGQAPGTGGAPAVFATTPPMSPPAVPGAGSSGNATWVTPVQGRLTSSYGHRHGVAGRGNEFHTGLDIAAPQGTPVRAASGGVVKSAAADGNYGNAVVIDHGNGVTTRYAHNSVLHVKPGQEVRAGESVAAVGSTGRSTGPHLHFEVRVNNEHVDPAKWLKQRNAS